MADMKIALSVAVWMSLSFSDVMAMTPETSPAEALHTRQAAERGDIEAQFSLGVMYEEGDGVPQDYSEALKWFRKAAAQGDDTAKLLLKPFPYPSAQSRTVTSGDNSALVLTAYMGVGISVTDPQGHVVGLDPATEKQFGKVQNGGCMAEENSGNCEFSRPVAGLYKLGIIPSENGVYLFDVVLFDKSGKQAVQTFKGPAILGRTYYYNIVYNPTSPISIKKSIP